MGRNLLILVITPILLISCIRKSSISDSRLEEAKRAVVISQDADSYCDVDMYYSNDHPELYMEQLPYDLVMCKANNDFSCFRFYENYLKISNSGKFEKSSIIKLDKPEQDFLIYILNKGAILGDEYCRSYLYYYYKNGIAVKKDLLKADSLSRFFPEGHFDKIPL
ncbi:MAG: hypothetical protein ACOYM7_08365 [Paludibacter sp.]